MQRAHFAELVLEPPPGLAGVFAAKELAKNCEVSFPNESAEYRRARTALLAEEIELRRHIERVAEMRRDCEQLAFLVRAREKEQWGS